jgi:hypothetical protein
MFERYNLMDSMEWGAMVTSDILFFVKNYFSNYVKNYLIL